MLRSFKFATFLTLSTRRVNMRSITLLSSVIHSFAIATLDVYFHDRAGTGTDMTVADWMLTGAALSRHV